MWEADIYINSRHVFFNHFGYGSFSVDITDFLEYNGNDLLAVSVLVPEDCSRWYPGAGIYRNVYLVKKSPEHIRYNGVWIRQLEVAGHTASFLLELDCTGDESLSFRADIFSPDGTLIQTVEHGYCMGELSDIFTIHDVQLWDIDSPLLYTAKVYLLSPYGQVLDDTEVRFGARTSRFDADKGYFLNNRPVKLRGVCLHHDLGSLGAAVNTAAMRRQLRLMREMGVNAIRTSHNPPAPELLDLCDELGFLVMDEFFDEWTIGKVRNGYARYFSGHACQDMTDVIRRDRNHPSVILWSIGNEIREQMDPACWRIAKRLSETVRMTDPTRPVTAGLNDSDQAFAHHLTDFLDVVGLNYKPALYPRYHREHPDKPLLGAETASCVSTRGVYTLPAKIEIPVQEQADLTVSAYELAAPFWAYYPERELAVQDDFPYIAGEFLWTGMDYLGEPTPYRTQWPSRSSYFGAVDLAGLPKNRFYAYKAHWTDTPVLHIFPHWNWDGREGHVVPVHVYSSYPMVELFVNGVSQGKRVFTVSGNITDSTPGTDLARYRLMWNDVIYSPGTVKAVAYDEKGHIAAETLVRTAGTPHHLLLTSDRNTIAADGEDLVYVTAAVVDAAGTVCPLADNKITFAVEGAGEFLTTDSGDQRETESFARPDKKALAGYTVACVRSLAGVRGQLTVCASAEGLCGAEICLASE